MSTKESASSKQWPRVLSWLDVTGGCVLMLLIVQFLTGVALAFYYVPSVDHAHTTVSFIEKVLSSGSWLRALHHYGSQWLPLFVFLHLVRLRSCEAYKHWKFQWVTTVLLLGLVLAAGATGYSLPWDARAFFSTRVAEGLLGGLPVVGRNARLWLLGGPDISTLTLSRLFALHVLVTPFAIVIIVGWRLFRERYQNVSWTVINRNIIAAGIGFLLLVIWSLKFPAPLGPAVTEVTADYLPRPGAQFLWLFQTLKYLPGGLGSLAGIVLPGLALLILLLVPWLDLGVLRKFSTHPQRIISNLVLAVVAFLVLTMTMTAYLSDWRDLRIRQQLAKQAADEKAFRSAPFRPVGLYFEDRIGPGSETAPKAYLQFCANCHGVHGEGATQGQLRFPPLIGVAAKSQRTVNDIVALLNDPTAFGLEPPMRSFATKLTEAEKREIAEWVVKLK
jgi:ubiquinol-cytochrome c reductase cytochrome b subunit